jgi:hypothetical protein
MVDHKINVYALVLWFWVLIYINSMIYVNSSVKYVSTVIICEDPYPSEHIRTSSPYIYESYPFSHDFFRMSLFVLHTHIEIWFCNPHVVISLN